MAQRKYDQSLCRLSKPLRSEQGKVIDKVTIGGGCLVSLKSEGEETLYLITTTQVVNKKDLLSESSHGTPITVEFLDGRNGKLLSLDLNFNYKDAAESIPDPISGRVMPDTEELEEGMQVSFIVIPVKKFDTRGWWKRALKPLAKRSIPFSHETDENLWTAISNRQVLCYVICDDRKSGEFYIAEPSCLTFDKDGEFVLASTSDNDSVDHPKTLKDLPTEQKPKGALFLNGAGKLVGMLAVSKSEKRKLYPVFLPNLGKESTSNLSKNEQNSALASYSKHTSATSEIRVKCEEPRGGCNDKARARQGSTQANGNGNKGISGMNQASVDNAESEHTKGGNSTSACEELQGSCNPAVPSLKSNSLPDAQSHLNDQKQQGQLPLLGQNPEEGSNQNLVEPHDNLQESSESHDSSGTNPEHDQSSGQASASSACHSAGDRENPEEGSNQSLVMPHYNVQGSSELHDSSGTNLEHDQSNGQASVSTPCHSAGDGENPEEGSNQNLVEPHDNLQESSESHDSSGTNPEHDQSSGQASASSAWHSARDGENPEEGSNQNLVMPHDNVQESSESHDSSGTNLEHDQSSGLQASVPTPCHSVEDGENPEEGSNRNLVEPHDNLRESSESNDSSGTNPEHDQSSGQASASSAWHSAGDGENPQEGSNQHSVTPHDNIKESSESHDSSSTNPEEDQSSGQAFASFACHSAGDWENPEEASNQNLVKLHHNLQKTSKSHDSSGTNLQHDQSSGQASAFSAWHSAGDKEEFSSINVNAHDYRQPQNSNSRGSFRPSVPRQHSYHDPEATGLDSLQDEVNHRTPIEVSDPSLKGCDQNGFTDSHPEADRGLPRSQSDVFSSSPCSLTGQVNNAPRTRHSSIEQLEHVSPGSYVKDKIVSKASITDMICLHLDRSVSPRAAPLVQRWEHLADEFKVPEVVKVQCANYTGTLSPSEAVFEHLHATRGSLPIQIIKRYLRELERNDVDPDLSGDVTCTVAELCENWPETLSIICIHLDDKRSGKNWYQLGIKIGIKGKALRKLQNPSEDSPADTVLRKIKTLKSDLLLTDMERDLKKLKIDKGTVEAIAIELHKFQAESTIETLLEDLDVLEEVTALLDHDLAWWRVGKKYGMSGLELDSLRPECPESPTKLLMKAIVAKYPYLNMKRFLEALANIKRDDVINKLKDFFYAKDIDAIRGP